MTNKILTLSEVTDGDTGDMWEVGVPDGSGGVIDLTGYSCQVIEVVSGLDRAETNLNGANNRFLVQLTPAETDAMNAGTFEIKIRITNAALTPVPYRRTGRVSLVICADD